MPRCEVRRCTETIEASFAALDSKANLFYLGLDSLIVLCAESCNMGVAGQFGVVEGDHPRDPGIVTAAPALVSNLPGQFG